jgi:hypothetical protein
VGDDQQAARSAPEECAKPVELLELAAIATELFTKLKAWFGVPDAVSMPLACIAGDDVTRDLRDAQQVAAFAMRKLQALYLIAQPGVSTKADVPLGLIDSVIRALVEAPGRHLSFELAATDWDREWQILEAGLVWKQPPPEDELPRFRSLIGEMCEARRPLIDLLEAGNPLLV